MYANPPFATLPIPPVIVKVSIGKPTEQRGWAKHTVQWSYSVIFLPADFGKSIQNTFKDDIKDEEVVDQKREEEFNDDLSFR